MKKRRTNASAPRQKRPEKTAREQAWQRFLRQNTWLVLLLVLILVAVVLFICVITGAPDEPVTDTAQTGSRYRTAYICAETPTVPCYDAGFAETGAVARGSAVTYLAEKSLKKDGSTYYLTYFDDLQYGYVDSNCFTDDPNAVVLEKTIYVRTPQNLRLSADGFELGGLVEQGTELQVLGFDSISNGVVHLYHVTDGESTGYISGEYTAATPELATEIYDRFGSYSIHMGRLDRWGGGDGGSLDYYPREKANFEDNVMPNPCYALYLTCDPDVLDNIDAYIEYAKSTNVNAFVVNIIDCTSVGYPSPVYQEYSPTAYQYANNTIEEYRACIQKIKDAGFYAIGRLTAFNDSFFVSDHPEYAIADNNGDPLYLRATGSYWPSAFCRYVWEYKVALAKDAVETMGFQEIQFDYVRFPDGTYDYEKAGTIDYRNENNETKAQAIQRFLMYATDELHDLGVYVGADVFGESVETYVTAYGQYWAAISNVVDVISGMPYPDHFSQDGTYRPWEHPYETIYDWSVKATARQAETPTPAIVRTWIQAYDAIRPPYNTYGADEIGAEIQALEDAGLSGGFMAWNAMCSLSKLEDLKPAFDALTK